MKSNSIWRGVTSVIILLLFTFVVREVSANSGQVEEDSVITQAELSSEINSFTFEFKNAKDSLTIKPFDYGNVYLSVSNIDDFQNGKVSYKEKEGGDWVTLDLNTDNNIILKELPENNVYSVKLIDSEGKESNEITINTFSSTLFEVNTAKSKKEESAKISWAISLENLEKVIKNYPDAKLTLKYNTKIGDEQNKTDVKRSPWIVSEPLKISALNTTLEDLKGGEKYVYKIGLVLSQKQTVWSSKGKFTAERPWGLFKLLVLIGSLGMFIFGMKIMSEGLQIAAGSKLRGMLSSITSNRVKGVLTGFGITSIVQSSSVTTVMTVSFVNAGLLTLVQSAGIMMGANIGTTITGWLILLFGFKISLSSYALIFIAFGAPLMFFSKGKIKTWASIIIGFSLLFMGLGELKDSVPSLGPDSAIVQFFIDYKNVWYGPLMFVFLGTIVTVVIQSSSAAMALTMTLVAEGVIPFEVAAAMILGENIGTTITAELASIIGNVHAKRSARIHSLFNVIGVTWMLLIFPFFIKGLSYVQETVLHLGNPILDVASSNTGLSMFHTGFNLLNVLMLIWFVPQLVSFAERSVKSRGGSDEEFRLDFIGDSSVVSSELSILEASKEIAKFGELTSRMSGFTKDLLNTQDSKVKSKMTRKIQKYEEIGDRVEVEIINFLAKVSRQKLSKESSNQIQVMISIIDDLESITDIFYRMSKNIERKNDEKIWFTPDQREQMGELFDLVDKAFVNMIDTLNSNYETVTIGKAEDIEKRINLKRNEMRKSFLTNLEMDDFNQRSGIIYNDLFTSLEKIGDYIFNVTEAMVEEK